MKKIRHKYKEYNFIFGVSHWKQTQRYAHKNTEMKTNTSIKRYEKFI
jgi:hypothetical protein